MPRRCSVCDHAARDELDRAIASRSESNRSIATRWGLSSASVHRHSLAHLAETLRAAYEASEEARADSLLDQVRSLHGRTLRILATAEADGDAPTALRALREARSDLELLAKLVGELESAPTVHVAIGSEWPALRTAIVAALEPYPAARGAVLQAIARSADVA